MAKASERATRLAGEVLAKIAAYDPYFPKPNEAQLMAWAEHISLKNPDRDDMLDAVTKFYESNTENVKPLPASISTLARSIRQDRLMRGDYVPPPDKSDDPEDPSGLTEAEKALHYAPLHPPHGRVVITMEEWEARHGEKFPELKVGQVMDAKVVGNPLRVRCPYCKSNVGVPCVVAGTSQVLTRRRAHNSRWEELRREQGNE